MSTPGTSSVSVFAFVKHRTASSLALLLACAAVSTSPTALAAVAHHRRALTVRVYQIAGLPSALEKRALAEARTLLGRGLVDVRWQKCTSPNSSPICTVPPERSELLLVLREGARCQDKPATLGEAIVGRQERGVLATVYVSCVTWLATAAGTDVGVLLGRVTAHELGHLMIGDAAHARRGLMRANWTSDEVRRNRAADWAFTAADVAAMRQPGKPLGG